MNIDITTYHRKQAPIDAAICDLLAETIEDQLPEAEGRIWHAHPVWFLDGNPIVGYGKLKDCIRLLFWSGQSFPTAGMKASGSFKASELRFQSVDEVDRDALKTWLAESRDVQWDYANIVKRRGRLERLK